MAARRICHVVRWSRFDAGRFVTAELHLQHLGLRQGFGVSVTGSHKSKRPIASLVYEHETF